MSKMSEGKHGATGGESSEASEAAPSAPLAPPLSGGQRKDKLSFERRDSIDWISFSFPSISLAVWKNILKETPELHHDTDTPKAVAGYKGHVIAGYGMFGYRYAGTNVDGLILLPGKAMAFLREYVDEVLIVETLLKYEKAGIGRFTKIDTTADIIDRRLTVARWAECLKKEQYGCAAIGKKDEETGERYNRYQIYQTDGITNAFDIGSRVASRRIKVYNKTLEQERRGAKDVPQFWTRVELSHTSKLNAASLAAMQIVESGLVACGRMIAAFLTINDEYYQQIFSEVSDQTFPGRSETDPEKSVRWVSDKNSGIPKILASIERHLGFAFILQLLAKGRELITENDQQKWNAAYPPTPFQ